MVKVDIKKLRKAFKGKKLKRVKVAGRKVKLPKSRPKIKYEKNTFFR